MANDTTAETEITTDRETIRAWVDDTGGQPAYVDESGERHLHVHHPDSDTTESVEETTWDDFFERFEDDELVLVRHPDRRGADQFELLSRTEAMERAALEDEEVERALLEGEVVTSEITETKVVERTVRETETIESEVIDSEVVSDEAVDSRLVRREIPGIHLGEDDDRVAVVEDDETIGWEDDREEIEHETVTLDIDETREVTREIIERKTVESRVVDREVEGTETVESDTLEGSVDLEGVHRTIVESDILGGEMVTEDVVEGEHMESEFTEEETILTELYERRTVEEEVLDRKRLTFELVSEEILNTETVATTLLESELIGTEEATEIVGTGERAVTASEITEATGAATGTDAERADETTAIGDAPSDEPSTTADPSSGATAAVVPVDGDVGKQVIDAQDEKIGGVTEVDAETGSVYVDPNPGLAERIKTRLGWESHDDDAYAVEADRIDEITDDEVRLRSF
jgi:hypothetical protein